MAWTPRKNLGTTWQFKATSGGSYATIKGIQKYKRPRPVSGVQDLTPVEGPVEKEGNTIINWTDLELQLLQDDSDTVHIAMQAAIGGDDCYAKVTFPSGRTIEYVGNAKENPEDDGTAKNYEMTTWKMHPNATPTNTDPP